MCAVTNKIFAQYKSLVELRIKTLISEVGCHRIPKIINKLSFLKEM